MKFLDWFIYSDNTIDGQSKKKAYTLLESDLVDRRRRGTIKCLTADPRLPFRWSLRLRGQDTYKDNLKGQHRVLSGRTLT